MHNLAPPPPTSEDNPTVPVALPFFFQEIKPGNWEEQQFAAAAPRRPRGSVQAVSETDKVSLSAAASSASPGRLNTGPTAGGQRPNCGIVVLWNLPPHPPSVRGSQLLRDVTSTSCSPDGAEDRSTVLAEKSSRRPENNHRILI